jgi:hypothetical protein
MEIMLQKIQEYSILGTEIVQDMNDVTSIDCAATLSGGGKFKKLRNSTGTVACTDLVSVFN